MADTLRIVALQDSGRRPAVLLDLNDTVGQTCVVGRDTFTVTAPPRKPQLSDRPERYGGSLAVAETHDNGSIGGTFRVRGATAALAISQLQALLAQIERVGPGRFVEWRPDGGPFPTYFELRGPATWNGQYRWVQFAQTRGIEVELTMPVAPLSQGAPMDHWDDFAVDSLSDYTFDSGGASNVSVGGGVLTAVTNVTVENRVRLTSKGYQMLDDERQIAFTPGSVLAGFKAGVTLRASSASTYVAVYIADNGTTTTFNIDVNGVNRVSTATSRISAGRFDFVRGRIEGGMVFGEFFLNTDPTPGGPATNITGFSLTPYQLTTGEQAALPAAGGGWVFTPQSNTAQLEDYRARPFTWRARPLPDHIRAYGQVPGDAPALVDVELTSALAPAFALVAWAPQVPPYNMVWNGAFDTNANGWQIAAGVSSIATAGAISVTRTSTAATPFGIGNLLLVNVSATANSGTWIPMYRRFKRGTLYTVEMWVRSAALTITTQGFVAATSGGGALDSNVALSTTWTKKTFAWTPSAEQDLSHVGIRTAGGVAGTFEITGVRVYEGTVPPTLPSQTNGRGGFPPFGIIEAESADTLSNFTLGTGDSAVRSFGKLSVTASAVSSASAEWFIDPHLMAPDSFTLGDVDIEVWARGQIQPGLIAPKIVVSAKPATGLIVGTSRFTSEWQSSGKPLQLPSTVTVNRIWRLGTLKLPSDAVNAGRWKLKLEASWLTGSTGAFVLDYLALCSARRRACSPTGKPLDASYPNFMRTFTETTKVVRSDLSGYIIKDGGRAQDQGLGGSLIQFDPGSFDLLVDMSNLVPDDPTVSDVGDTLTTTASVHLSVTPRYFLARGT